MTLRSIYLDASRVEDAGYEIIGELVPTNQQLAAAIAFDDREQPLITRINSLVMACTCGVGDLALPLIRHRDALDKAQRAATESAQKHASAATQFARLLNGIQERVLLGLRSLSDLGKRKAVS